MEKGSSTSLGVMVAIIIFSLFLLISGVLYTSVGGQIDCITEYVGGSSGGCGGEVIEIEEEVPEEERRQWPSGEDWVQMASYDRRKVQKEFALYLAEEIPGFQAGRDLPYGMENTYYDTPTSFIYGNFDESGNIKDVYTLGDMEGLLETSNGSMIHVSDSRLLPSGLTILRHQSTFRMDRYETVNSKGNKVWYTVYK